MFHHDDYIWKIIEKEWIYEKELIESVPDFKWVFVDVGANIWVRSKYFAEKWYHVYAFEPVRANFDLLEKNTKDKNVVNYNVALSSNDDDMYMNIFPENMGMCRRYTDTLDKYEKTDPIKMIESSNIDKVKVKMLDKIGITNIGLIKIDVEGMELDVILWWYMSILCSKPIVVIEENSEAAGKMLITMWYKKYKTIRTNSIYIFKKD